MTAEPTFRLGFATLAALLADLAVDPGTPLENEQYQPNGDSTQRSTSGLYVWRKADNWTAFTDGYQTWINGPFGVQARLNTERFDWEPQTPVAPVQSPPRRFIVWNGTVINSRYQSLGDIKTAIQALLPEGNWIPGWAVKAGEGGTWQSAWDGHPLAVSGPDKLTQLKREGDAIGMMVVPYFVVRGRPLWVPDEIEQIAQAARVAGWVILNLEPGAMYWNGATEGSAVATQYLQPLRARIAEVCGDQPFKLIVAGIPRQWVIDALGGVDTLDTWAQYVDGMCWECYDAVARDLDVSDSMDRVREWLASVPTAQGIDYRVPIVQRSRVGAWAYTPFADGGLYVWHLDGDI